MRVLHVINSLAPGGAERLVSELLPALAIRGIECSVLALDERGDAFSPTLRDRGIEVAFARPGGSNPYSPARLLDLGRELRARRPDIVHAHLGPSLHWCATSPAARRCGLVVTEHASANRRMGMPFAKAVERALYGRYDRIAAVSEGAAEAFRSWLGVDGAKVAVVPNGIDLGRFSAGAKAAPDVARALDGGVGIAMVARLVPEKDHATALRALAALPSRYRLVLAGEGPERERIAALANALGLARRCLFLGSRSDVPSVLAACSAFLQSSYIEGFGIAALEAMAAGIPVVASEAPGLGDLVRGAGITFPVGDAAACAAALAEATDEERRRSELVSAGRARAAAYSIGRCADSYEALYREVLEARA